MDCQAILTAALLAIILLMVFPSIALRIPPLM